MPTRQSGNTRLQPLSTGNAFHQLSAARVNDQLHGVDLYADLGLTHLADAAAVRAAYRRLAKLYHPDVSAFADAHQRFIRITEAYEVLGDPERRKRYDLSRLGPHPHSASPRTQARYAQDVHRYQREARERAERFSRMKYERFDVEYFDSVFAYVAPKMLGCLGIGLGVIIVFALLMLLLLALPIPDGIRIPVLFVMLLGGMPLIAWLSVRFDSWHNAQQKGRKNER